MDVVVDPTVPEVKMYRVQFVSCWKFLALVTNKQREKNKWLRIL